MKKHHLQEKRIRPMFFAWACGILSVGLLAGVVFGYSALSNLNNNYSSRVVSGSLLISILYVFLAVVGFLGFFFFCIGLPILYAGSLRLALRIFVHLIAFFIVVGIVLFALTVRINENNSSPDGCNDPSVVCVYGG